MSKHLDKTYDPKKVEDEIYRLWEKSGYFNPDKLPGKRSKTFTITVPPPNITGSLHMGHALNAVIQDILIRKKRMAGYKTLWLPGTDHAGIATQNVVEKDLKKQGIGRYDLGQEKFLEKIWEWKERYGHIISDQFKKLGSSMDWSRIRFTMDADYQKAVKEAFLRYYKKGWIYQAERVINWCIRCSTSLSDLELEYKEEKTVLYYLNYPLVDKSGFISVATTRPETMLGDSAVAVNPKDARYKKLIGKSAILPIQKRKIPIIGDKAIDLKFGTGAVKVTPAHDLLDAEIGERHKLPFYKVIGSDGRMTKAAGPICEGLKITECRAKVVEALRMQKLIKKAEAHTHNVAHCYRCGTIIEPLPSLQWFVKMDELAKMATGAVKSGKVKFHPKRWEKVYLNWLNNIKDWCISRQIWWGHKIPLTKCISCDEFVIEPEVKARWYIVRHGETDWNKENRYQGHSDIPLNEVGKKQAKILADKLKIKNIDLIITSDLTRCKEMASIISKTINAEVVIDKRLRERNGGEWEGLHIDEICERHGLDCSSWPIQDGKFNTIRPPGGENLEDVEKRVLEALRHHRGKNHHRNIVIITHLIPMLVIQKKSRRLSNEEALRYTPKHTEILELLISQEKCKKCGSDILEPVNDVLDTWFSSALWPFVTLGWPNQTRDLKKFYPTQVLSTARDIINLWVARMVYSGLEFTGKKPFDDVIIHATILTKEGKRMSKSLGTGIDPMHLISQYGSDATRFGLIWQAMGNQDIHWSEEHVIAGKKFANKIWNASRFVLSRLSNEFITIKKLKPKTAADKRIIIKLQKTKREIDKQIEKYVFGQPLHRIYDFFWHDFCDKYIEESKQQIANDKLKKSTEEILVFTLFSSLKLLHPFMPFVTEEIYQKLPLKNKKLLMVEKW